MIMQIVLGTFTVGLSAILLAICLGYQKSKLVYRKATAYGEQLSMYEKKYADRLPGNELRIHIEPVLDKCLKEDNLYDDYYAIKREMLKCYQEAVALGNTDAIKYFSDIAIRDDYERGLMHISSVGDNQHAIWFLTKAANAGSAKAKERLAQVEKAISDRKQELADERFLADYEMRKKNRVIDDSYDTSYISRQNAAAHAAYYNSADTSYISQQNAAYYRATEPARGFFIGRTNSYGYADHSGPYYNGTYVGYKKI